MILILFDKDTGKTDSIYYKPNNVQQLHSKGIFVDEIPEAEIVDNKYPMLYVKNELVEYNKIYSGEDVLYYEYEDIPKESEDLQKKQVEERIEALEKSNAELMGLISTMSTPALS